MDQAKMQARPDVLVYTSEVLTAPVDVTGPVNVSLYVSSDAKDTDLMVKLVDVHPDGKAYNLDEQALRLRWREGYDQPVFMEAGKVYKVDAEAKERKLTPAQRLQLHQERSKPVMEELEKWMSRQCAERLVEPNSGLGKAITYLQRHWKGLTLFLRQEGAPLDNNLVERVLKKAVLHRKNALYYRTIHGAEVGDLFMSLIETCRLNGVNSFDYLVELQRHAAELLARPADWMPWNYRATIEALVATN